MRSLRLYSLIVLCSLLFGCERIENANDFTGKEVKLFARMGVHLSVTQQTKGDGVISSATDIQLPIGIVRLDGNSTQYPASPLTAIVGKPNSNDGNLRAVSDFSTSQFFNNSTDNITYMAWYPWPTENTQEYSYSSGVITFPIPAEGDSDIMYSNVVDGTMSTGFDVMQFSHALSLFRIYAYKSSDYEWGKITSVQLTGLPDKCTVTLPKDGNGHIIEYTKSNETGTSMSYSVQDDDAEIPQNFENKLFVKEWLCAPSEAENVKADNVKILNISVTTSDGDSDGTHTIPVAGSFKPGYAYNIVLRFSEEGIVNAQAQIAEWPDGGDVSSDVTSSETFYNLSANGTANCYIVSSANFNYCFDVTVKGNKITSAMPGSFIDPTIDPHHVEIIWSELPEDKFILESNDVVEGKALFRLIGNTSDATDKSIKDEGNVLIGAFDENNNCLWTWHIWVTDKPKKQNYKKGYIALDRNLGATASSPGGTGSMNGLFYQWGRPTPFRVVDDVLKAENVNERVVPDVAVANPLNWYGADETVTASASSFTYNDWVDRTKFGEYINNLWGYRRVEHEQPIKTIYDPCPPGYHVPYARTWEMLEEYWDNKPVDISDENWRVLSGIKLRVEEEGTDIWYPFQGYITKDGVYKSGHIHIEGNQSHESNIPIVEMWSSLINRHDADDITGGIAGTDYEKANDSPYRFLFTKEYGAMLSDQYSNRSRGLAVRCVSDNTADVVKDLSASQTANCYMVHEAGYYKFKTTTRGNGVGSLLPLGGTTTAEINGGLSTEISPDYVDILWWQGDFTQGTSDFPADAISFQEEAPANMCLQLLDDGIVGPDGYVAFHISNFKKGNVVLAAYDRDTKQILWTWHIWLTDKPDDKISGNYTKMDRFLGATFAPSLDAKPISWGTGEQQATLGFYYQWGRKDPIIGPPSVSSGTDNSSSSSTAVASSGWWKKVDGGWSYVKEIPVKDKAPIPTVVKDPTAFYRSTSTGNATSSQWFPESFADGYTNVALWGYAVADYSIEGQTFSKTMHDPCPPGYRTPFHFSWRYDSSEKYAEGDLGEATTTLTDAEKGYGPGIVTDKTHFEKMWFPFAGYRNPLTGGYTEVGSGGYMNTGMPMGQYNTRSFWYNSTTTGQYAGRHGSAYGKMVRCMKE